MIFEVWLMYGEKKSMLQKSFDTEIEANRFAEECERGTRRLLNSASYYKVFPVDSAEAHHDHLFRHVLEEMRKERYEIHE